MEITINKMLACDLDEIKDFLISDYDDFWNYNIFKSELENENSIYLVAKYDDLIVGFAGFTIMVDEADITNIVVKKDFRNKKIGTKLLEELLKVISSINYITSVTLEVSENNKNAIKLYENFGFSKVGFRKNYYADNSNAILMTKDLT